jgi:tetratricopeptide (TPR) repeat protein
MNPQLQLMLQEAYQAFQIGNLVQADEILKRLLKITPQNFDVLHLLAITSASQSKHDEALHYYRAAAKLSPQDDSVLSNWGSSLNAVGQNEEALSVFKNAIEVNPSAPEIWYNAANTLCDLERYEEAIFYYKKSIEFNLGYFQAHNNCGKALFDLRRYSEALTYYDNALSINPFFLDSLINRGEALRMLKRLDDAIACYDKAISLQSDCHQAWSNKGVVLHDLERFYEAINCYDKAISLQPEYYEAWSSKGVTLHDLKCFNEAIACYDKALSLRPGDQDASWNKCLSLLIQGNFEDGFPLYESRWNVKKVSEIVGKRSFSEPTWLGVEPLQGKTILIYGEQGLGDFIHFCRYVKLVSDLGAEVILEAPKPLAELVRDLEGVTRLIIKGESFPYFDYQCPLLSLPLALKTNISNIPSAIQYINFDRHLDKVAEWKSRLGFQTKRRIGLVWSGNPRQRNDHNRSLLLGDILPFLPDQFEYISLQKELREVDQLTLDSNSQILSFTNYLNDFVDTAALIENLDLVISVDTSVAHLSGALGKKTLVLLSSIHCWRWLLERDDTPWYPSMRLYRQETIGDWEGVFNKIKLDLNTGLDFQYLKD